MSWRAWLLLAIFLLPFWMLIWWYFTPTRKLTIAIVDKTVVKYPGQEHISLHWILNQEKFTKNNTHLYDPDTDYFGFFPMDNERYKLQGLEQFDSSQLIRLSKEAAATYITDAYGVFKNEWYKKGRIYDRSGLIYGGMSKQDIFFLEQMRREKKLIIAEFNAIGSPTEPSIRHEFEHLFGLQWSGWIGRYFESFDTTVNKELPAWLINGYMKNNGNYWPFTKGGIAFINAENDNIVILEEATHLKQPLPYIHSTPEAKSYYGIPDSIKYSFWFDIITADTATNKVLANFRIKTNELGKKTLALYGIPESFPAITAHTNQNDYRFYYFSADFCDNPVSLTSSYLKGISLFKWMMYTEREPFERKSFFWKLYRPLLTRILNDEYERSKNRNSH